MSIVGGVDVIGGRVGFVQQASVEHGSERAKGNGNAVDTGVVDTDGVAGASRTDETRVELRKLNRGRLVI